MQENAIHGTVREADLLAKYLPISSTELWRKVRAGDFPKPIRLGQRVVAWNLGEVLAWLETRPRYDGPSDQARMIIAKRHPKSALADQKAA